MMGATELVVPRSMPSTFATRVLHVARMGRPSAGPQDLQRLIQEADCFAPVGSTVASVVELAAELLKPAGELQRELDPGQVHAQVLGQVLNLAQAGDVLGRVQADVAAGAARLQEAGPLVLAQRGRV